MKTLIKYFKTAETLPIGTFLSNQVTGRLYVVAIRSQYWIKLIDVETGRTCSRYEVKYESKPTKQDMQGLLYGIPKDSEESLEGWHKVSQQEAIGRFAKLVLTEK